MDSKKKETKVKPARDRKKKRGGKAQKKKLPDPRVMPVGKTDAFVSNANKVTIIEIPLVSGTLAAICAPWILNGISRGFAQVNSETDAYAAWVYTTQVLTSYALGLVPPAAMVPKWLHDLGNAIKPKTVITPYGNISYKFTNISKDYVPPSLFPVGRNDDWAINFYGKVQGPLTAPFPLGVAPPAYDVATGEKAYGAMLTFVGDKEGQKSLSKGACVIVDVKSPSTFSNDVSCFSAQTPTDVAGVGQGNIPGNGYLINHEVPIWNPILTVFPQSESRKTRYPLYSRSRSGDLFVTGNLISGNISADQWGSKPDLYPKYVDFLELADVLAQWVGILIEKYLQLGQNVIGVAQGSISASSLQCPLTLQEMQLLLRNEVMYAFKNTCNGTQALSPDPLGTLLLPFYPFVTTSTTVPMSSSGVSLPMPLVENIKCLITRSFTSKDGHVYASHYPVPGIYQNASLTPADYTYSITINDVTTSYPSFRVEPPMERKVRTKNGEEKWEPVAEIPINLIDGSGAGVYYAINDPTTLLKLATKWNEWIVGLSSASAPLSTLATDSGPGILAVISTTRYWADGNGGKMGSADTSRLTVRDVRDKDHKHRVNNAYSNKKQIAITSMGPFVSGAWESVQSYWVLPTINGNQTSYPAQQKKDRELFSLVTSTTEGATSGPSLAMLHSNFASQMAKVPEAPDSEMVRALLDAEKQGHGGILSGLISAVAGQVLGPQVGEVAKTISGMLPF